jgi:hypothetical protein
MLERSFDVERINAVVNHPEVRPFIGNGVDGDIDTSVLVDAHENWFLMGEHGGFLLGWSAPGAREVHTFILPEGRGKWANDARTAMIDYARAHGAEMLWTKIAPDSKHVVRYARQGGMQITDEMIETFGTLYRIYRMELRQCQ